MAAMTTVLTDYFPSGGNLRTWALPNHSSVQPEIVTQRVRIPVGDQVVDENTITILRTTKDADGNVLPQKASIEIKRRFPINGTSTDLDAVLAYARDIFASDEYTNTNSTSEPLKP